MFYNKIIAAALLASLTASLRFSQNTVYIASSQPENNHLLNRLVISIS